jgi:hypothetical protein
MGGMGRIYYSSISRYARDHNIPLYPFVKYLYALDEVWMEVQAEKIQQQRTQG